MTATKTPSRPRDVRLDFFRGIAMFIIVVAHIRDNPWTLWIPARFGFSDATEIFVFCSGMASALAFGSIFARSGFGVGAARIAYRVWQVYWAHVGTFLVIAALCVALTAAQATDVDYVQRLNLHRFFADPEAGLVGLLTLTYVPNYFDILPMYLVILAMIPAVIVLARVSPALVAPALAALWLAANLGVNLPAEPWSERPWFFNPFGWQALFFTGFAFMAGWLRPPPVDRRLVALALAVVALSVPFAYYRILNAVPQLRAAADAIGFLTDKSAFGVLRYAHFLALAYLGWVGAGPAGARLVAGPRRRRVTRAILTVGQQSLAVFVGGLVVSQLLGAAFDVVGRDPLAALAVNLTAFALVVAIAYFVAWIKGAPWTAPAGAGARDRRVRALAAAVVPPTPAEAEAPRKRA